MKNPSQNIELKDCEFTIVLGETQVGKTFRNKREVDMYIRSLIATGKQGRKVLIFDRRGEYTDIATLAPTPDNIRKFTMQKTIEDRRVVGVNTSGTPMKPSECIANVENILTYFRNGLLIFDDIDSYAVYSQDQDVVGMIMGYRHIGCDVITVHQSWRKITTTEADNANIIRLHKTQDTLDAMPPAKQQPLDYELCTIADIIVKEMYYWAEDDYAENKITKLEWQQRRSYHLFLDVRTHKMWPITQLETFTRACEIYFTQKNPALFKQELQTMLATGIITAADVKNPFPEIRQKALDRLIHPRLHMLRCKENYQLNI